MQILIPILTVAVSLVIASFARALSILVVGPLTSSMFAGIFIVGVAALAEDVCRLGGMITLRRRTNISLLRAAVLVGLAYGLIEGIILAVTAYGAISTGAHRLVWMLPIILLIVRTAAHICLSFCLLYYFEIKKIALFFLFVALHIVGNSVSIVGYWKFGFETFGLQAIAVKDLGVAIIMLATITAARRKASGACSKSVPTTAFDER